jgi:hypothetical protein
MQRSGLSCWISVAAVLLFSTAVYAANRGSLQIPEEVSVNGQSLPAGDYQVKWDGDGPNADLRILRNGKVVATIQAHTTELVRKDQEDSVLTKKNDDGTASLLEIHFAGKKYAFAVVRAETQESSSGSSRK